MGSSSVVRFVNHDQVIGASVKNKSLVLWSAGEMARRNQEWVFRVGVDADALDIQRMGPIDLV